MNNNSTTTGAEDSIEARDAPTAADGKMAGEAEATAQVKTTRMTITEAATTHPAIREEAGPTVAASTIIGPGPTENQNDK
jgi:hypothetical protein